MKKAILLFLLITACKKSEVIPQQDVLTGQYSRFQFNVPGGRGVYKTLEFEGQQLKINYKFDKKQVWIPVGTFSYGLQGAKFWVLNADATRTDGELMEGKIVFGGEEFGRD